MTRAMKRFGHSVGRNRAQKSRGAAIRDCALDDRPSTTGGLGFGGVGDRLFAQPGSQAFVPMARWPGPPPRTESVDMSIRGRRPGRSSTCKTITPESWRGFRERCQSGPARRSIPVQVTRSGSISRLSRFGSKCSPAYQPPHYVGKPTHSPRVRPCNSREAPHVDNRRRQCVSSMDCHC